MPVSYDKIAPVYDLLSRIVFGGQIVNAQRSLLKYIQPNSRILIVGGGTGWILEEIAKLYPSGLTIDYVESSTGMMALSKKRNYGSNTLNFINLPIGEFNADGLYDVVFTPLLFDNFRQDKAERILTQLCYSLATNGLFLFVDFVYNPAKSPLWQKLLLKVMYIFFRITCHIEANELVNMNTCFDNCCNKIAESSYYFGFIIARVYQKVK